MSGIMAVRAASCVLACWAVVAAHGQSNSLMKRGRSTPQAPSAVGVPEAPEPAVAGNGDGWVLIAPPRAPVTNVADPRTPLNPALLQASLIAVELPPPRKFQVHDLLTIIVREDKTATSDSQLKSDKEWTLQAELSKWIRINSDNKLVRETFPNGTPAVDWEYTDEYEGKGKYNRKDSLILRITARVLDIKPNGNLVLEATKSVKIDEEGYIITLTGECRSDDVTAQNTVLSTQVANPVIDVQHNGAVRDAARRGWLKRLGDLLRPF